MRALHEAILAADRVVRKPQEYAAVVGDELAQPAQRGDRIGVAVEHVHERDETEASAGADAEDLTALEREGRRRRRSGCRSRGRSSPRADPRRGRSPRSRAPRAIARAPARGIRYRESAPACRSSRSRGASARAGD
jgi:hypothetical protein